MQFSVAYASSIHTASDTEGYFERNIFFGNELGTGKEPKAKIISKVAREGADVETVNPIFWVKIIFATDIKFVTKS